MSVYGIMMTLAKVICRIMEKITKYDVYDVFQKYFFRKIFRFYDIPVVDVNVNFIVHKFNEVFASFKEVTCKNFQFNDFESFFSNVDIIWLRIQNLLFKKSISELITTPAIINAFEEDQYIKNFILKSIEIDNHLWEAKLTQMCHLGQEGCRKPRESEDNHQPNKPTIMKGDFKTYQGDQIESKVPSLAYNKIDQKENDTPQEFDGLINTYTEKNQNELKNSLMIKKPQRNSYRYDLIQNLESVIPEILNFYSLSELNVEDIKESALKIFDYTINNGMTQNELSIPYNSNKMALVLIFYALLDLGVKSLGITSIGQADIGKALINVYNKLNFSNSDSMLYLKPKIIYEFLPERLKKLLDSLPSPKLIIFNQYYENEVKKYLIFISNDTIAKHSISVINGNNFVNMALTLFNQAQENKLTPDDLKKNRMPNQLALMLIYFTLIHYEIYSLGGKIISISSIIDSINDFAKLDFNNKESAYNIYPIYLLPFLPEIYKKRVENLDDTHKIFIEYDQNFRKKLENYIRIIAAKVMSTKYLDGIKLNNIISESLRLFDIALKNGLIPNDLKNYRFARHLSICLIYFSLVSLNVISLGSGALSVRDISNIIGKDYHKLGFGSEKAMRFGCGLLSKYIPEDVLDKADKIPQTIGTVFNDNYFNDLENYIAFIADQIRNNYKLNIKIKDLTSLAIRILEDCIKNGLEPSDLGDNKSVSFMSIILSYYALISLKITKLGIGTITLSKIIDLLIDNYEQIGFSSFWFSDKVVAGRIYSFLPEDTKKIVDLLPERELVIGKYESLCKRTFDEVFSELYNMKIKFIPHLSLYKLVSNGKNNYISEYIKRAHLDGAFKVPLPKNGINKLKHRLHINIDIPRNINEVGYNIDHIDLLEIQRTIEKIKDDFAKNDLKLIKIQFTIGHIKIFIKNDKMSLYEREIYIPLTLRNENLIWVVYEYNGIQHYKFPNYFHKNLNDLDSFLNGICNDFLKRYLLIDNGVILIEFPYWVCPKMNNPNKIKSFIKNKVKSNFRFS